MTRFSLLASLLLLTLMGCKDDLLFEETSPQENPQVNCIYQDCITGKNPLVSATEVVRKSSIPLAGLQRAFDAEFPDTRDEYNFAQDGYPAWNLTQTIEINQDFAQYLVPVFSESTDRTGAIILFTHYLAHGVVDVNYVYRDRIGKYPAYETLAIASKLNSGLIRDYTREAMVYLFSILDGELFSGKKEDLLALLTAESRADFESKDCKVTVHYALYDCQDVYGGEGSESRLLYTACVQTGTRTEEVGIGVGCDGGRGGPIGTQGGPTGGPTTGGTIGGDGTIVINTDPNSSDNRCIEDGVDCEEEEEEEEEEEITIDPELVNNLPCAADVVQQFLLGNGGSFADRINEFFANPNMPNVDLTITSGYAGTTHAFTQIGNAVSFNGTVYTLDATITMNDAHPNNNRMNKCSQDMILSTLVHELIHAEIIYLRARDGYVVFANGSGGFNFTNDISGENSHDLMTARIDFMADILIANNPALDSLYGTTGLTVAQLMSWVGLEGSTAYGNLSGDIKQAITDVSRAANCQDSQSVMSSFGFKMCP